MISSIELPGAVKSQTLRITEAKSINKGTGWERVAGRRSSVKVHAQHLAIHRSQVLGGGLRVMVAGAEIKQMIWPNFQATSGVIGSLGFVIEKYRSQGAGISGHLHACNATMQSIR